MGLKWRHHSRYYITAWDNGPYVIYEKRWWKHKRIAQFDRSLEMAIWYVQELEPNSSVSIVWLPRESPGVRPLPISPESAEFARQVDFLVTHRYGCAVHQHGVSRDGRSSSVESSIRVDHPLRGGACGEIRPGDTVIALAKPARTKYTLRRMNARREMEDVP
jgi:hypothetical protein